MSHAAVVEIGGERCVHEHVLAAAAAAAAAAISDVSAMHLEESCGAAAFMDSGHVRRHRWLSLSPGIQPSSV